MTILSPIRKTPFAFTFANTTLASQRAQFELQFNLLQNSLIKRYNANVEKINQTPPEVQRKIDDLSAREKRITAALPALSDFRQGNENNKGALEKIFDGITSLFSTFNTDSTVDSSEVAAFEKQRDIVASKIENLYVFSHPDINDAKVIQRLKENVDTLRGLQVTAGNLTDAGNKAVADSLTSLQSQVSVGITVTENTVSTTLNLEQNLQAQFANADADLVAATGDEKARREKAVTEAENKLGTVLRAISISFEANAGLGSALTQKLKPTLPPPGSAVNIIS